MRKVLVISNKSDLTSDFVIKNLKSRSINFYRFNTEDLLSSINITADLKSNSVRLFDKSLNQTISLKEFGAVYYRRPKIPTLEFNDVDHAENTFLKKEIAYLFEGIYKAVRKAFWISPPFAIREAENKMYQLEIANRIGFKIPNSFISNSYSECLQFYNANSKQCIVKPIKSGLIEDEKGTKVIFTNELKEFPNQPDKIESFPLYIQEKIDKKADVRVIVVGKKIFATLIHSQSCKETKTDWRRGEHNLEHVRIDLPKQLKSKCIKIVKDLGLQFGAIDLILDKNEKFIFLEINPNGQWAWIENKTGYNISSEIVNLLINGNH